MDTPTMTRSERENHVRRIATHGLPPQGPVSAAPPATELGAAAGPVITLADLLMLEYHAEPYTLHNGSRVWVHPLSIEDAAWLNCKAADELAAMPITNDRSADIQFRLRAQVWQVVACLHTGPEPTAPKSMGPECAEILRRNAGWIPDIQAIVTISDALTGGSSEVERLRVALAGFFDCAASFCATFSSQLSTASPEELQSALAGFAGSVSAAKSQLTLE